MPVKNLNFIYLFIFAYFWLFLFLKQQAWATDDVAQIYDKCITELEQHLHAIPPTLAMNPQAQALRSLLEVVVLSRNSRDAIAALGLLQKVGFKLLLIEGTRFIDSDLYLNVYT